MEEFLKNCKISKPLINAIKTLGYTSPTAVQKECIPLILSGQEVSAKAPTGTGKTAAFAIPIIELLSRDPYSIFSVIITPTRELALQINDQFQAFGSLVKLKAMCITGGVDIVKQTISLLSIRPHVVIATPGRLNYLLQQADVKDLFKNLHFLVLDEVDFLEESQKEDLNELLSNLSPLKTLKFSATLDEGPTLGERGLIDERYLLVPSVVKDVYL